MNPAPATTTYATPLRSFLHVNGNSWLIHEFNELMTKYNITQYFRLVATVVLPFYEILQ